MKFIKRLLGLFLHNFYLDEEVAQAELRRAPAEDSLTWLSGLMEFAAMPFTVTPRKHSEGLRNYYWYPIHINIHIILKFGQHIK
jgi:hypothetical protein